MSAGMFGALIGLALAFAGAGFLFALSRRVDLPETRRALRVTATAELLLLPAIGWFLGPLLAGE